MQQPAQDPSIEVIESLSRRLTSTPIDPSALLTELRQASAGRDRAGCFVFEFDHGGRRVAVVCGEALFTAELYRDHASVAGPFGHPSARERIGPPGISSLRSLAEAFREPRTGLAGLAQSVFMVMGYDAARHFEPTLDQTVRSELPDCWAIVPRSCVALDLDSGEVELLVNAPLSPPARAELDELEALVGAAAAAELSAPEPPSSAPSPPRVRTSIEDFRAAVARAREYIMAGDIFQVVLSLEAERPVSATPLELFQRMRAVNRQTANFMVEAEGFALVGASPEILVEKLGSDCVVRPLAGTLAHSGQRDPALEAQLLADDKECAEHRMLVDLARNDLGRVCEFGSVRPERLLEVEYFYRVMHISSEIRGRLRHGADALDLLSAGFPAGTMTGAPKIRAMEIIDELEDTPRSFYSGGLGFLTGSGDLHTYISIRSLTIAGGIARARAGAGIVYNSEADKEYRECMSKLENAWRVLEG